MRMLRILWEVVVEIGLAGPDLFLFLPSESEPSAARDSGLGLDRRAERAGEIVQIPS